MIAAELALCGVRVVVSEIELSVEIPSFFSERMKTECEKSCMITVDNRRTYEDE